MKITVNTYSITHTGGGVFDAVRGLYIDDIWRAHSIEVLSFVENDSEDYRKEWPGLNITLYQPKAFLYSKQLRRRLKKENADILHMHCIWRYPHLLMSMWVKKKHRPLVCTPHGMLDPYIISSQGPLKRLMAKLLFNSQLKKVTCFHALCKKELEDIRSYGLTQPVAIIPNGVCISNEHYPKRNDKEKHLLYLGRIHKKKGLDLFLYALAELHKENPQILRNWHVNIVGWDHEGCLTDLLQIVKEEKIESIITFHGALYGKEKEQILRDSDAFILPSHGEGMPMSVLEAWAYKLPVLMTPQCNIPEGFEAYAAVRIDDNIASIKNGLVELFGMNSEELKYMGNNGYQLVKEKFSWNSSAKKMEQLYQWLLGNRGKPEFVYV